MKTKTAYFPPVPWTLKEHSSNVHEIAFGGIKAGWEQWVLLQSDEHYDNAHCDRALYFKHLNQAKERRAPVIKYGDLFCAMQGKWDKRADQSQLRTEHRGNNYLDRLVTTTVADHLPYADILAIAGLGNHETGIIKHHQTNLTERFVEALRSKKPKTPLRTSGFSGWVRFHFLSHQSRRQSILLWFHHGYGGGGPVTRGVIQTNRRAVYVPQAHIIATGHTHDAWIMPIERIELSQENVIRKSRQYHVSTPGYKDEYADGAGGWHIERGGPPKPTGGAWVRFWFLNERIHHEVTAAE